MLNGEFCKMLAWLNKLSKILAVQLPPWLAHAETTAYEYMFNNKLLTLIIKDNIKFMKHNTIQFRTVQLK